MESETTPLLAGQTRTKAVPWGVGVSLVLKGETGKALTNDGSGGHHHGTSPSVSGAEPAEQTKQRQNELVTDGSSCWCGRSYRHALLRELSVPPDYTSAQLTCPDDRRAHIAIQAASSRVYRYLTTRLLAHVCLFMRYHHM
jgi:hypothetical protein